MCYCLAASIQSNLLSVQQVFLVCTAIHDHAQKLLRTIIAWLKGIRFTQGHDSAFKVKTDGTWATRNSAERWKIRPRIGQKNFGRNRNKKIGPRREAAASWPDPVEELQRVEPSVRRRKSSGSESFEIKVWRKVTTICGSEEESRKGDAEAESGNKH